MAKRPNQACPSLIIPVSKPLAMFDDKVTVPKLASDGSNWVTYSKMMLWIVNSMELQEQLSSTAMTPTYLAMEGGDQQKAQRTWNKGDWTLKTLIGSSLPESIFNSVTDKEHAKDVWDTLKGTFEAKNIGTRGMLHRKLQSIRCIEGGN